jgi:hypothetical protein
MKIVSISNSPTVCDGDGSIRGDVTDLNRILDSIDQEGRNDAVRAYIYALRDLQRAHDRHAFFGDNTAIDPAQTAVAAAFDRLILAEFSLNRSHE